MLIIAIDTAASLCAACVYDAAAQIERGRVVEDIGKGHAERLMGTIAAALGQAGIGYADIGRIAVSTGPGSFTGVRVGVAAARGLALALKIPAVGLSTLEALAAEARTAFPENPVLAVIDGRRGDLYAACTDAAGHALLAPTIFSITAAVELARKEQAVLTGSGADLVLAAAGGAAIPVAGRAASADIAVYARLAAAAEPPFAKPKPLYLRGPDARPQQGFALKRAR